MARPLPSKLEHPERKHPNQALWVAQEERQRASYLADRAHLLQFLAKHRYEGNTSVEKLPRSKYGYSVGVNKAYLSEIIGHVADSEVRRTWGPIAEGDDETTEAPEGDIGSALWENADRKGVNWNNFFNGTVLEWLTSSVGGFILTDAPPVADTTEEGTPRTEADDIADDNRPYLRFIPWSSVEDFKENDTGLEWVKMIEHRDTREPDEEKGDFDRIIVFYLLLDDGTTMVQRYDDEGKNLGEDRNLGEFLDRHGRPTLPLVPVKFGQHPDAEYLGGRILLGLDDIAIDLFNVVSETRAAFRDATFSVDVYAGDDPETVSEQLKTGTRLVTINPEETLMKHRADSVEVELGLQLLEAGVNAWALSARRKAAEAQKETTGGPRSGVAIEAEFQLDLKPLLVSIAETLDEVEASVLYLLAQWLGEAPDPEEVTVQRDTNFRTEDEASRIARLVNEFASSLPLPPSLKKEVTLRWADAVDFIDLEAEVEGEGTALTFREVLEAQLDELAEAEQARERERAEIEAEAAALARGEF